MATMIKTGTDVIAFLEEQHEEIKAALEEVKNTSGDQRSRAFVTLRRMLAVHEAAEEEIVHPAARRALPNGDAIVEARLEEEKEAKTLLTQLEKLDCDSVEFEEQFAVCRAAIIGHAEAEERDEFAQLGEKLDAGRLARMRKAAELAEAVAPTRPHPGVESAAANLLIGPFASMIDRSRDALSSKR